MKLSGKRSAGNPHAAFDVAEIGNGLDKNRASLRPYLWGEQLGNHCFYPEVDRNRRRVGTNLAFLAH